MTEVETRKNTDLKNETEAMRVQKFCTKMVGKGKMEKPRVKTGVTFKKKKKQKFSVEVGKEE